MFSMFRPLSGSMQLSSSFNKLQEVKKCINDRSLCVLSKSSPASNLLRMSSKPGPFYLENGESCPFCEDENKIPVVINNNLSKEIIKIPMNVLRDDANSIANQFEDLFQNSDKNNDNALRKIYTNYVYKEASNCSLNKICKNQSMVHSIATSLANNCSSDIKSATEELNNLNHAQNNVDPSVISYLMQLKQKTHETPVFDIDPEPGHNDIEKSRQIGIMIQSIIEDYKKKFNINEYKEQSKKSDCNTVGKKALNICRQKDPFLREINIAIFGALPVSLPKEDTDEYYKLAQDYAIFLATPPSTSDFGSSKNDYSPSKSANDVNKGALTADSKTIDFKRPAFEDPAIISEDAQYPTGAQLQQQSTQQQQQSFGATYPAFDPSKIFQTGASQGSYASPNAGCSCNVSPYQLPGSFLSYNNLIQKAKPRTSPKLPPTAQVPMFLSPHQFLMQASQSPTFSSTQSHRQTMMQPQPNFANLQAAAPFYKASFKETHINTAFIQQQQYQQYNVLAAAAAGNYEMLIYEQMLHQTQKIKTVVARNRLDKRIQSDLAKNALKTNNALLPTVSANNPFGNLPGIQGNENLSAGNAAIRQLFSQMGGGSGGTTGNGSSMKGITDPAIISAVDSGSTCVDLGLEANMFDMNTRQQSEAPIDD